MSKQNTVTIAFDPSEEEWQAWEYYSDGSSEIVGFGDSLQECLKKLLEWFT